MTDKRDEALKLALEALEKHAELGLLAGATITALREALADHIGDANKMVEQSAQQPRSDYRDWDYQDLQDEQSAQQQEPVATGKQFLQVEELLKDMLDTLPYNSPEYWINRIKEVMPFYTSPPASKPWVGLSTDEIYDMYNEPRSDAEMVEFARAIEAKLKEKNNG